MSHPPEGWITTKQAAAQAGVHPKTVTKWWKAGKIRGMNAWDETAGTTRTWIDPASLAEKESRDRAPKVKTTKPPIRVTTPPPSDGPCLHGRCHKQGRDHHWGLGFRFCDVHMPILIMLERGTLTPDRREGSWKDCQHCGHRKRIVARGLCNACYKRVQEKGLLDAFAKKAPIRRSSLIVCAVGRP